MLSVTKRFEFDAAHKLPYHKGKCVNLHGHLFILDVEVSGEINMISESEEYGMIIDFGVLKNIVNEHVISKMDHSFLNDLFVYPTAEFMVTWIAEKLSREMHSLYAGRLKLVRVRLYETPTSYAEWRIE